MLETRTRKQGRSVVVTLPADETMNISVDKTYLVTYNQDGSVLLIPKIDNPFLQAKEGEFYTTDVWEDITPVGLEVLYDD